MHAETEQSRAIGFFTWWGEPVTATVFCKVGTDPWIAALTFAHNDGRAELVDVSVCVPPTDLAGHADVETWFQVERFERIGVNANVPPGGLTQRKMRAVTVGAEAVARRELGRLFPMMLPQEWAGAVEAPKRPGRRGRDERYYAELAAQYAATVASGTASPLRTLAERLHLSDSQARNLVYEARKRALLTPAVQGRAGGTLTQKALDLLEQED